LAHNIYIISGLGVDERVFQKMDFSGLDVVFVKWIKPEPNESIENYTSRLLTQITVEKPILVGLSFGGMIAIEIAKQISTKKLILLASAKTKHELPFYFRWAGFCNLHKFMPARLLKHYNFFSAWLFGAVTVEHKKLLKTILHQTDPIFLKWAIDKIVKWQTTSYPENITHIHGTADHILPFRFIKCDTAIKNAGHFMTMTHANLLTQKLRELL
jgi:pimeloyl-ACP methyl ester carboxylesterase